MRHRIARHAVDLALELGSNHVTLEAICERSTISHRTFYSHFDTKEAAIVGDGPTLPSEEALAAFHASDNDDILSDLLTAVISSLSGIGAGTDSDHELDRAILIRKEPSLTDPLGDQMTKVSNELTQHVLDRLTRHDPNGLFADPVGSEGLGAVSGG